MRVSGNSVTLRTNATLKDMRWTPDNVAEIKRKVSLWVLGHEHGNITIYSANSDIETLVTPCAKAAKTPPAKTNNQSDLMDRQIAIYPSHGMYYNRKRDEWIWQRATLWTTVEDVYSQEYVRLIKRMLENAGASVIMPRAGIEEHHLGLSGMPQWVEGARYWLMSQGADSTLWDLYDGDEYKDDMKCRAMWLNSLETPPDLCIALHTDGLDSGDDTTIVGTLAIYTAKDDEGRFVLRDGRDREKTNRNLADWIQTQLTEDLRHIAPEWTRRQLKEANYCESRVPVVPGMILELLSHKNMADMKYGLDPHFRFAASRAVYKGILRYLNGSSAIVQPLPVKELAIHEDGLLQWVPTLDSIEPSAKPTYYMVYTQINDEEWDVQQVEKDTHIQLSVPQGVQYNCYVVAGNEGGLSFPSPIVSTYRNDDAPMVLIVDGFNEVYGPDWFADSIYAGIVPGTYACEDGFTCAYIGQQWNFTRSSEWKDDDNCGWGACYRDHAGELIIGNTHDYAVLHGRVLRKMRVSYVSCTPGMMASYRKSNAPEWDFALMDYICGRNKQPLSEQTMNILAIYMGQVGKLLLSSDHLSALNPSWTKQYLHASYYAAQATHSGRITSPRHRVYQLALEPNAEQLFTCHPEALKPENGAIKMATYEDMRCTAAVGYQSQMTNDQSPISLVYGFPLEAVTDFDKIYRAAIKWLLFPNKD
jgi:N-acetylmuramoyl-L-alanine amidase